MPPTCPARVVITGATGYLGSALAGQLRERGHQVVAFVRPGGGRRAPAGTTVVEGDALQADDVARAVQPGDTLVHLVGTPRPSPAKGAQFLAVDLPSIAASAGAAARVAIAHLVYVSVAHPAPVMRDYIAVRVRGEVLVEQSGVPATILRPWYVLGPGHWWPYALLPLYGVLALLPATRPSAERLGLVRRAEMVAALVTAVETPPAGGVRVLEVPAIRRAARGLSPP